jgi:hypothetical protein
MKQNVAKTFGVPSPRDGQPDRRGEADFVRRDEWSYRFHAGMRELEAPLEAKASELRAAFLAELADIQGGE